jgi:hypothetical protein
LIGIQNFDAGADAEFLIAQQVDNSQASGVSESFEEPFQHHLPEITIFAVRQFL